MDMQTCHKRSVSDVCAALKKEWICCVCLELMYRPHRCVPCGHSYCQPCLQRLASLDPQRTLCPVCRCLIDDCVYCLDLDNEIRAKFPTEYKKIGEPYSSLLPLPGRSAKRQLTIRQWLRFTLNNRANRHMERTDRVVWHFASFVLMITVVIISLYLVHFIIMSTSLMYDYIPVLPLTNKIELANVPFIVIGLISALVLLLR